MISVVIPTCNRNDLLIKCLDRLGPSAQQLQADEYELIVTDDSKNNVAKNLVNDSYPWATWVPGPKRGPAANRNNGVNKSNGEWIVFIDDDCLPDEKILNNYRNAILKYNDSLAFEGAIVPDNWDLMKVEMAECPVNITGNCFWSANVCIQKQLFIDIGGFDELFLIAAQEDQDIFERLKKRTSVRFLQECVVVHPVRFGSFKKYLKGIKPQFANWIYYQQKHSGQGIRKQLLKSVFDYVIMAIKNILKLKPRIFALNILKAFYCIYLAVTVKESTPNS